VHLQNNIGVSDDKASSGAPTSASDGKVFRSTSSTSDSRVGGNASTLRRKSNGNTFVGASTSKCV